MNMDDTRLVKKVFLWDKMQPGRSWNNELLRVFDILDFDIPDTLINLNTFTEQCKYIQNTEWLNNLVSKPKLRTYVTFKDKVCTEPYIYNYLAKGSRCLMAQFRSGVLPLHIETGRYDKTPLDNRVCKQCALNVIEDEYHFLCVCPSYETLRPRLYAPIKRCDSYFSDLNNRDTFCYMMKHHQLYVANYISEAWTIR